jgi:hypothetical protein
MLGSLKRRLGLALIKYGRRAGTHHNEYARLLVARQSAYFVPSLHRPKHVPAWQLCVLIETPGAAWRDRESCSVAHQTLSWLLTS